MLSVKLYSVLRTPIDISTVTSGDFLSPRAMLQGCQPWHPAITSLGRSAVDTSLRMVPDMHDGHSSEGAVARLLQRGSFTAKFV